MYTNYEIVPFHWLNIITYEFKWQNITITMYLFKYLKFKSFKFFFSVYRIHYSFSNICQYSRYGILYCKCVYDQKAVLHMRRYSLLIIIFFLVFI